MMVYDLNKSQFGLNPIKCYRLSEAAIEVLSLNDLLNITDVLVQDKINEKNVSIETMFEEVKMKIHRSHLLQAYLFDHIQPNMPVFNTNILKLGSSNQPMAQHLYHATQKSQALLDEMNRTEIQHKN